MRFRGLKAIQQNEEFIITALPARELAAHTAVDVWGVDNPEGYQRKPSERRARDFGRFVEAGGVCPTALLLNIREEEALHEVEPGVFELDDDVRFWLVDGQHRLLGLQLASESSNHVDDFMLPVIIMQDSNRYTEAEQYLIINRTQKGVRADLAERILAQKARREGAAKVQAGMGNTPLPTSLARDIGWRSRAVAICDALNERTDSPLRGKIKLPNVQTEGATVTQKSMSDSLKYVLQNDLLGQRMTDQNLIDVLIAFWNAVQTLCPEPFQEVQETGKASEYLLLRTAGPFILHRVLPRLVPFCPRRGGLPDLSEETFEHLLSLAGYNMSSDFWRSSGDGTVGALGSSQKSFALAADIIVEEILDTLESGGDSFYSSGAQ